MSESKVFETSDNLSIRQYYNSQQRLILQEKRGIENVRFLVFTNCSFINMPTVVDSAEIWKTDCLSIKENVIRNLKIDRNRAILFRVLAGDETEFFIIAETFHLKMQFEDCF